MQTVIMSVLIYCFVSVNLMLAAVDPKSAEPTLEQIADAKKEYAKFGASYASDTDARTKQITHVFIMPVTTTDSDLKGLPDLPFRFGLQLSETKVTDAGLKEIKRLKNLTNLNLADTNVTDAELKELRVLQNLTRLYLNDTKVTDDGVKELKKALPMCEIFR